MSLINKMLQDLDARGSHAGSALQSEIRPVALAERKLPVGQIAIGAGVAVIALAAAGGWWLKRPVPVAAPAVVLVAPAPAPAKAVAVPESGQRAPMVETPAMAAAAPVPQSGAAAVAPVAPVLAPVAPVAPVAPLAAAPIEKTPKPAPERLAPVRVSAGAAPLAGGRDMNDAQRSETHYRNALAALDEGRVTAALGMLEQALKLNARHDAARQSLVALLIEAGRNDEAMQQLEQGLALDTAQPALAMLLARMQIERGSSGVATLLRTLPSAEGNADYHAFLAGALQREQRHREAALQYGAALRGAPDNGVWLMGLGISLQADKRNADALAAFQRARKSGMLSAPLVEFVDRKIAQLGS